jgi:hypothetical protein
MDKCEIMLHKRFHMFDFIYYNNSVFHSTIRTPYITHTTY